ncbi:hypothetical protein [Kribbella shirazensis]|uniref:Outer membrane murein-binding lipoprotein Lpp n=1 Tax=Kribbella shirazensis TaxID=1105143 RepID=A0A7X5VCE6_9ACTN|nr:hypothetical protein [Kribbella shirazensis]NIK58659.1 outer membrane murein-binding lipoprotein Lpp [Kribbella shirazensis]
MLLTRRRLIITAALATVLVAGCGGSGPPTVARSTVHSSSAPASKPAAGIAQLSAQQILKKARAEAKAAVGVRIRGDVTLDDGKRTTFDVSAGRSAGSGTITIDGDRLRFLMFGRTAYLQFSDAYWRQQRKSNKDADRLIQHMRGKWLKVVFTSKEFAEMPTFASLLATLDRMLDVGGGVRKIGARTIGGIPCIGVGDGDQLTLWVDAANARPIRVDMPAKSSMTFSGYNQIKEPKVPPATHVVDSKSLRG